MKNNYYDSPKASWLMRLFWKACGADRYILERGTYSDQIKYFCLGGIVIATGVLAGVAGGYAIYTIFEPKLGFASSKDEIHIPTLFIALVFGVLWGLIIFNIDRFIVTSTGKGDGTEAITGQEFKSAIPRIIMGLIIALTISKPIEIRMFKSEIEAEITTIQKDYLSDLDDLTKKNWEKKLQSRIKEKDSLNNSIEKGRLEIASQRRRLEDEAAGLLPPNPPGRGPAWKDKKENLNKMEAEYTIKKRSDSVRVSELSVLISRDEKFREDEYSVNKEKVKSKDGLLLRLTLAHKIAGFWISLFITLLFIVIELTPIFFKMMLIKGPYDYADENIKELAKAEAGIEVVYDFYTDKEGMERHKVINHAAELKRKEKIAMIQAQEELNNDIIEAWKQKKKEQINKNPDDFIYEH